MQCSECLLYWNQGIVYCTCGHVLVESKSSQKIHQWRLDAFSIPHFVIKKERPHAARHGKTEAQKQHFLAHNARRRCIKMNFDGIHDRFQRDPVYRDSQLKICWTEEKCIAMDKLAQEDHSYCPSSEEYERYKKKKYISLNKSGRLAPMKLRSDFREAVAIMNRLHRESGEERPAPIFFFISWQSAATDGGCEQNGSRCSARHAIHVSCACVSDLSSTLHFALFTVSPIFYFILLIFIFTF